MGWDYQKTFTKSDGLYEGLFPSGMESEWKVDCNLSIP